MATIEFFKKPPAHHAGAFAVFPSPTIGRPATRRNPVMGTTLPPFKFYEESGHSNNPRLSHFPGGIQGADLRREPSLLQFALDALHHRHRTHEHERGDDLMRAERGVEESPGDANRRERLHHFEVAGGRGSR